MYNPFKEEIVRKTEKSSDVHKEIITFSRRLQQVMSLSQEDIGKAEENEIYWHIGDFTIYAIGHPFTRWSSILEVAPLGVTHHGYLGQSSGWLPKNWHYKAAGTNTEILPDGKSQSIILDLIAEEMKDNLDVNIWKE